MISAVQAREGAGFVLQRSEKAKGHLRKKTQDCLEPLGIPSILEKEQGKCLHFLETLSKKED